MPGQRTDRAATLALTAALARWQMVLQRRRQEPVATARAASHLVVHGEFLDPSSITRPWGRSTATGSGGRAREANSNCDPAGSWAASSATRSRHAWFSS